MIKEICRNSLFKHTKVTKIIDLKHVIILQIPAIHINIKINVERKASTD